MTTNFDKNSITEKELATFKQIPILSDLEADVLFELIAVCRKSSVKAGEVVMREGEPGDTMMFFLEGIVNITNTLTMKVGGKMGYSEVERSLISLDAKIVPVFGEMAMFEDAPRSASITAKTDCLFYEIKKKDFQDFCKTHPNSSVSILTRISTILSARSRKQSSDILKLTTALSIALSPGKKTGK